MAKFEREDHEYDLGYGKFELSEGRHTRGRQFKHPSSRAGPELETHLGTTNL